MVETKVRMVSRQERVIMNKLEQDTNGSPPHSGPHFPPLENYGNIPGVSSRPSWCVLLTPRRNIPHSLAGPRPG